MSSSPHIDYKKKEILILVKVLQRIRHTLTAEKINSFNFTKNNTKFYLCLQYNVANRYLFVNGTKIIKFKARF